MGSRGQEGRVVVQAQHDRHKQPQSSRGRQTHRRNARDYTETGIAGRGEAAAGRLPQERASENNNTLPKTMRHCEGQAAARPDAARGCVNACVREARPSCGAALGACHTTNPDACQKPYVRRILAPTSAPIDAHTPRLHRLLAVHPGCRRLPGSRVARRPRFAACSSSCGPHAC
jgi:hypothetical protein